MADEPSYTDKPYKTGGYRDPKDAVRDRVQNRTVEILPHPEVLESYNYVVDGSAKMILSMFENEQKHRHEWELLALQVHKFSVMIGQICGCFALLGLFASAAIMASLGQLWLAAYVWSAALALLIMAGLVWAYALHRGDRPFFPARPERPIFRKPSEFQDPR